MSAALFPYYERELIFIRQLAQEFARQYPAAAGRLLLEPDRSADPHVERLMEGFALLAARVHAKLDDEFPELTDALLSVLYPHSLAPIPSLTIVGFDLDPARAQIPKGFVIPAGSRLHSQPVSGVACRYRTCYPVTLWPVNLTDVRMTPAPFGADLRPPLRAAAALVLNLETLGGLSFAELSLDRLRFYLNGDGQLVGRLYELLFNSALRVDFLPMDGSRTPLPPLTPAECLFPVGFERDEGVLPLPPASFPGYRLFTEMFAFPNKYWFVDVGGFAALRKAGPIRKLRLVIWLSETVAAVEQAVDAATFRLGATPAINLFPHTAEPIPLTQTRPGYRVVADVSQPMGLEVYSVESVSAADPDGQGHATEYAPFYSFRHGADRNSNRAFWYASRRPSERPGDEGTEVYLNLVNLDFRPQDPADEVLVVRCLCTNRHLPSQLQRAGDRLRFELEAAAPISRVRCLRTPTPPLRPERRRSSYWRLISHLSLNHLSLTSDTEGLTALRELLALYDPFDTTSGEPLAAVNRQIIEGLIGLSSRRVTRRVGPAGEFARGMEVTIDLDEEKFVGTGAYLFAAVLERFLGLYAGLNSFSQLVVRTRQADGEYARWPPRAGNRPLL